MKDAQDDTVAGITHAQGDTPEEGVTDAQYDTPVGGKILRCAQDDIA